MTKWLEIDQDNLHMKFSALNAYCRSPGPNPLSSRRPAQAGVKDGYPLKSGYFTATGSCSMKTVADRHRHAPYQAIVTSFLVVSTSTTSNDLEPPKWGVSVFFWQFVAAAHISRVNCDEMDGDRSRQSANSNC